MTTPRRVRTCGALSLLLALSVVVACNGSTVSPAPIASAAIASPSPSVVASASPTPEATDEVTAHIEREVARLMTLSTQEEIGDWIDAESDWLDTQTVTVTVRPYLLAITRALADVGFANETTDLRVTALELYKAAEEIPGVDLP